MNKQQTLRDVDFAELYRNHYQMAAREPKTAQDWDRKAEKMQHSEFDLNNHYVQAFVSRMDLNNVESLLDVGCGGGAICLAIAPQVKQVYGLDYSERMLSVLQQRATKLGFEHVQAIQKSWDESWEEVPVCDICVSSRSSMVADLDDAIDKLNAKAKKAVYMTMIVEKDFIARDILQYIGRDSVGFPNYMYALNLLHQKGYHASVDFITSTCGLVEPEKMTEESFIQSVQWSIGQLTDQEIQKLKAYYVTHPNLTSARGEFKTWAFVSWKK
ncbi:class I SAM-dependent methyltransferase [Pasteurella multocida]|uniref:class I SAM-dependent methyltransferase n=1 Tax=Pasteurella multocida TaxID=747 RepID=UPI00202568A9|nr:class I SAM-dependent methyltransferase [Pasteurella multocida]MDT8767275.1 class I SAM-dependent methyltransferase [Pasteurella multocida]URJ88046.1 class I SAM-dependent methyltransferase [Pasteurella multocida]URJ90042.1 class I SAM-dependent methyltransferase [Pasteurella multocida]HDR0619728.1 methyltransferase domain-containing protein [Pasteurella multocida]